MVGVLSFNFNISYLLNLIEYNNIIGTAIHEHNVAGNTFASTSNTVKFSLSSNLDGFLINQYTPYIVVNTQ